MALACIGVIFLDVSNYTMGSLAYSLGVGMGSSMVAVRKAYAGSYSKLLALQKVAEVHFRHRPAQRGHVLTPARSCPLF
jgi:hypothetical protein